MEVLRTETRHSVYISWNQALLPYNLLADNLAAVFWRGRTNRILSDLLDINAKCISNFFEFGLSLRMRLINLEGLFDLEGR